MVTKQIKIPKFSVDYDEYADVLYVSFGKPKAGVACEVEDGDLVRIDPYTGKVVGITIIGFKSRYIKTGEKIATSAKNVIPEILKNFTELQLSAIHQ